MANAYFAVVYMSNGSWAGSKGFGTQEEALDYLREFRDGSPLATKAVATTVIKRDMSRFADGLLFGHPKSLDVFREKRKGR